MNLVIDMGNTMTKLAVFDRQMLQDFIRIEGAYMERILQFSGEFQSLKACIISSVSADPSPLVSKLEQQMKCILLDHTTAVPFENNYSTPDTLGKDRLAGIAAAINLFPHEDVLVIDAGTAITFDLITSAGRYLGGAIAPGIAMRYQALHTFTGRLPLLNPSDHADLIGTDTSGSIHSGVLNGVISEVSGIIDEYLNVYSSLKIILTGGDHNFFDKRLKVKTFAAPNLVLEGLNIILNYNLEKK